MSGREPDRATRLPLLLLPLLWAAVYLWGLAASPADSPEAGRYFLRSLGAARPGASFLTVATAPWLHGDLAHLASNVLGWLLLVGPLAARFPAAVPALLMASGALAGALAAWLLGPASMGPSGGVFALAGGLARLGPGPAARLLGLAWIGFGLIGGALDPSVDQRAHLLGALLGAALAPRLVAATPAIRTRILVPALVFCAVGLGLVLASREAATAATVARRQELEALASARTTLEAWVTWQARRDLALERFLAAGKDPEALLAALQLPPSLQAARDASIDRLGRLPGGLGVPAALGFGALVPAPPEPGWVPALDESTRSGWKALWAGLDQENLALAEAGELVGTLARRVFASPR